MEYSAGEAAVMAAAEKVRLLILDVDGVMTDGGITLDNSGNELKSFHVRDGHGIKLLIRYGIDVAFLTGRQSEVVLRRADELGVKEVHQKCLKKIEAYDAIKKNLSVTDEEIACIGDDIVDIPLLRRVGLPVVVHDADSETKAFASVVTFNGGGKGAVREVTDLILKAKGLWEGILDGYSKL